MVRELDVLHGGGGAGRGHGYAAFRQPLGALELAVPANPGVSRRMELHSWDVAEQREPFHPVLPVVAVELGPGNDRVKGLSRLSGQGQAKATGGARDVADILQREQ